MRFALVLAAFAMLFATPEDALAQAWPNRAVRIVVGQTPGSPSDVIARTIAVPLSELWHQPVVVDNRIGAGATIAADLVAKSPADGYTLLLGSHSSLAGVAVVDASLRYDPMKDFAPIGRVAHVPYFFVANSAIQVDTIPELVAAARAHPKTLTFISPGQGTASRMVFRLLMASADIELLEVPYNNLAPAIADLLAGRVDLGVIDYGLVRQHVEAGKLRFLGVTGAARTAAAPDVPTISEQGFPGLVVYGWYGLVAPAGVPADVRARLVDALEQIRRLPSVKKRLEELDYEPIYDNPAQFAAAIRSDIEMYARSMKRGGSAER